MTRLGRQHTQACDAVVLAIVHSMALLCMFCGDVSSRVQASIAADGAQAFEKWGSHSAGRIARVDSSHDLASLLDTSGLHTWGTKHWHDLRSFWQDARCIALSSSG